MATVVGYCPQFDAFVPQLTGRENLRLFARLRGVSGEQISLYVTELLRHLTLEGCVDRPAETYSGGNKRKLSVGIALIGNPPIVILDEPSTGVDPQARRSMWRLISSTMAHRSVILTTHSMEEAEALCDRVSIMHAGALQCIGRTAYLKNKYGGGLLISMSSASSDVLDRAVLMLQEHFPKAVVKGKRGVTVKVFLPSTLADTVATHATHAVPSVAQPRPAPRATDYHTDMPASSVFSVLERVKSLTGIETCTVATSTLEDVFLRIVAPQNASSGDCDNNVVSGGQEESSSLSATARSATSVAARSVRDVNSSAGRVSKADTLEEPLLPQ